MSIHWKIERIDCPECFSEDIFYKYDIDEYYFERCRTFYCECNECGCVWEEEYSERLIK